MTSLYSLPGSYGCSRPGLGRTRFSSAIHYSAEQALELHTSPGLVATVLFDKSPPARISLCWANSSNTSSKRFQAVHLLPTQTRSPTCGSWGRERVILLFFHELQGDGAEIALVLNHQVTQSHHQLLRKQHKKQHFMVRNKRSKGNTGQQGHYCYMTGWPPRPIIFPSLLRGELRKA